MIKLKYPYGTAIITVDTELTSRIIRSSNHFSIDYLNLIQEKEIFRSLLSIFELYSVPATWGIMGCLFLDIEDTLKGLIYNPIKHDIGCHSFSHINFKDCSRETASNELRESIKVMKRYEITPKTFIFPWNKVNHLDTLAENGFIVFRGNVPILRKFSLFAAELAKVNSIRNKLLSLSQGLVNPQKEPNGLWNIPGSMTLKKNIPTKSFVSAAKREIDGALNTKRIFHFYFHINDFIHPQNVWSPKERLKGVESIISYISKKREEENLQVTTMSELAEYLSRANEK